MAASLAVVPDADAVGELSYDGCLANDGSDGCVDLPGTPLDKPTSVAVSPDGKSVYVTSPGSNSITTFSAAPHGQISFQDCLSDSGEGSCGDLPKAPLSGARSVAVSPDGQSVYVASLGSASLSFFTRAPSGKLTFEGCLADSGANDCINLPKTPLSAAYSVAPSPDGGSGYVASYSADSVAHFFRAAIGSKGGGDKCAGVKITMTGSSKRDVLKGTGRRDVIAGQNGNDVIRGRGGNDLICGGVGKDKLSGGAGKDKLVGGKGKDTCVGGPGNDKNSGCEKGPDS